MIVLAVLVIIVAIFAMLLWTPVDVSLLANGEPEIHLRARISWLQGLVTTELVSTGSRSMAHRAAASSHPATEKKKGRRSLVRFSRAMRTEGLFANLFHLIRRLVNGIEVKRAEFWARAGLEDPADTGFLFAYVYPLLPTLAPSLPLRIDLEPDFLGETLLFRGRGDFRLVPARVLGPAIAFALSPPTLKALWAARA